MTIESIGSTCLGIVVGWLVRYFLFRFKEFNVQVLGSTLSLIAGGVVIGLFNMIDPSKTVIWFYPIGVLIGITVYSIIAYLTGAPPEGGVYYVNEKKRKDSK
jgi:hypothetical protein